MLWPKIEDPEAGLRLAFTGAVRDDILELEELASRLMTALADAAPRALAERYGLSPGACPERSLQEGYAMLESAARRRGFLISGGEPDTERMARILLDEFRAGKLGRITLEAPEER